MVWIRIVKTFPWFTPSWIWPGKLKELEVGGRWLTNLGFLYFVPIFFTFVLTKVLLAIAPSKSICSNGIWKRNFIWVWRAAEILSEETWGVQQPRRITPVCKCYLFEGNNKVLLLWMGFNGRVSSFMCQLIFGQCTVAIMTASRETWRMWEPVLCYPHCSHWCVDCFALVLKLQYCIGGHSEAGVTNTRMVPRSCV